jgi:WD40 repeat protein
VAPPGTDTLNASLPKTGYAWATDPNSGAVAGSYNVGSVDNYEIMSGSNVSLISGTNAIISNELFLTLSGFQSGGSTLALSTISGVVFSWDLNGQFSANGTLTPEPGTTGVVAMALMGLLAGRKALRRRNAAK